MLPLPNLSYATKEIFSDKLFQGIAVFLAYTMMDPLMEDIQDTFGKPFLYHPIAIWMCLFFLVYTQTNSIAVGITVIVLYESIKAAWRLFTPEPPIVGQVRKLLHRVQNGEKLSDRDVAFLDKVTPSDVKVMKTA